MKDEYKNILDELITNKEVINDFIDGRNLLSYLLVYKVITVEEQNRLMNMGPKDSLRHLVGNVLKTKTDSEMIRLLESFGDANYKEVFDWLQKRLERCQPETRDASQENVTKQLASSTAMSSTEIKNKLTQIFVKNENITPDLYLAHLVFAEVLTEAEKNMIESKITYIEQQLEWVKRLANHDIDTLKKIKFIARRMGHNEFANDLERAGF